MSGTGLRQKLVESRTCSVACAQNRFALAHYGTFFVKLMQKRHGSTYLSISVVFTLRTLRNLRFQFNVHCSSSVRSAFFVLSPPAPSSVILILPILALSLSHSHSAGDPDCIEAFGIRRVIFMRSEIGPTPNPM